MSTALCVSSREFEKRERNCSCSVRSENLTHCFSLVGCAAACTPPAKRGPSRAEQAAAHAHWGWGLELGEAPSKDGLKLEHPA